MFFFLHQLIIVYNESLSVYQFTVCLYDRLSFYQYTKCLYDRLSIYSPILFSPVLNDCLTGKAYLTWPRQHLSRPRYYKVKLVNFYNIFQARAPVWIQKCICSSYSIIFGEPGSGFAAISCIRIGRL